MRGTAHAWMPPYSVESIHAGNACDAATEAALSRSSRVVDNFEEFCIVRFRGGA